MRHRLAGARLMLIFTPEICAGRDPLEILEATLPSIDVVQIRTKPVGSSAPCPARETYDWCARALAVVEARASDVLVIVDDRVDVAVALRNRGCAGVHLGRDDCPPGVARDLLGPLPLIGLSTHDVRQVARASELEVDYLGFGPIHPTQTKGYDRGVGSEACWIARSAFPGPVFAIGGVDATNAGELSGVGRAAVGSAILGAQDPGRAAAELRGLLER